MPDDFTEGPRVLVLNGLNQTYLSSAAINGRSMVNDWQYTSLTTFFTIFTRLSSAALFKFSELQMRCSFGGGAQSGAALFKYTGSPRSLKILESP